LFCLRLYFAKQKDIDDTYNIKNERTIATMNELFTNHNYVAQRKFPALHVNVPSEGGAAGGKCKAQ
jgi:hypothetical protein